MQHLFGSWLQASVFSKQAQNLHHDQSLTAQLSTAIEATHHTNHLREDTVQQYGAHSRECLGTSPGRKLACVMGAGAATQGALLQPASQKPNIYRMQHPPTAHVWDHIPK